MILTALMRLAERDGLVTNPAYKMERVYYRLTVGTDGRCVGFTPLGIVEGRHKGLKKPVPRPLPGYTRRSGTVIDPTFLVDKPAFVLGLNAPADIATKFVEPDKLADQRDRFRSLVSACAVATGDIALVAVDRFLEDLAAGRQTVEPSAALRSNHLIEFLYEPDMEVPVHERDAVTAYLNELRGGDGAGGRFQCLVSDTTFEKPEKHPLVKRVPGGTPSGVAFVSFDSPAYTSQGLTGAENAPVSRTAAEAYTEAMARLLDDAYPHPTEVGVALPPRNVKLSADTVVLFWSKGPDELVNHVAGAVREGHPAQVRALFASTWNGRPYPLDDVSPFYALTLTGGQGRGTVRGWHETTLGQVLRNVRQYFDDIDIVRPPQDAGKPRPLLGLLKSIGLRKKEDGRIMYVVPPNLAQQVFQAALTPAPFPRTLLVTAVQRIRALQSANWDQSSRFGWVKAFLCRERRLNRLPANFPEVRPMVDEDCLTPAYRLGRLFAVLEKIQKEAVNPNTTIRERYYGAASATPIVVFSQLLRKLPHHLKNCSRPAFYDKLAQEIIGGLSAIAFPNTLSLEHQGLFAIGYYHESQALFDKSKNDERNNRYFPDTKKED